MTITGVLIDTRDAEISHDALYRIFFSKRRRINENKFKNIDDFDPVDETYMRQ